MMKDLTRLAGVFAASALLAAPALAVDTNSVTFAQFTQESTDKIAQYANTGSGNTLTISEQPSYFVVQTFGPMGVYSSNLTVSASSSAQITNLGLQFEQIGWGGSMMFNDGVNFLTVNFVNATFSFDGTGGSASLISTDPDSPISYSSNFLTLPAFDFKNFSVAFTGLNPPFTVAANGFGSAFNANVAGSFAGSALGLDPDPSAVPEPAAWAMLIFGFGLTGAAMRRRQQPKLATVLS